MLHARGQLVPGQRWVQESVIGSRFTGWLEDDGTALVPRVQGRAYVTAHAHLHLDPDDPFCHGIT